MAQLAILNNEFAGCHVLCSRSTQGVLKQELQGELKPTRRVIRVRDYNLAETRVHGATRDLLGGRRRVCSSKVILVVRNEEARCIRQIEHLCSELQREPFRERKVLED